MQYSNLLQNKADADVCDVHFPAHTKLAFCARVINGSSPLQAYAGATACKQWWQPSTSFLAAIPGSPYTIITDLHATAGRVSRTPMSLPGRCSCATAGMKPWMMWWCARLIPGLLLPIPALSASRSCQSQDCTILLLLSWPHEASTTYCV